MMNKVDISFTNMRDIKLDWNDISLVPQAISSISSRNEVIITDLYNMLPLFTAPMDTVIDGNNSKTFHDKDINVCLPRNVKFKKGSEQKYFYSYGLDDIIEKVNNDLLLPNRILIDVANGHMEKLINISKKIKDKYGNDKELMVGNIANPETYKTYCAIGVDYIRVGIGGGSSCTTSANVSIHYPMASLISECYDIGLLYAKPTKIIADGGFRSFSDVIKAIAVGADYVMLGGIFNKCMESCSTSYTKLSDNTYVEKDYMTARTLFESGDNVYKYYRGMSTKEVQKAWNKKDLKTGEGITKYNLVEYTLDGWVENFSDYLKSAMSYTGCRTLEDFIGGPEIIQISQMSFNRFHK